MKALKMMNLMIYMFFLENNSIRHNEVSFRIFHAAVGIGIPIKFPISLLAQVNSYGNVGLRILLDRSDQDRSDLDPDRSDKIRSIQI